MIPRIGAWIVTIHRAYDSRQFGPFATAEEAQAWLLERNLRTGVVTWVISPHEDTTIGSEVWL
jgi:hypothetical protein